MQRWSPEIIRYLHTAADRSRYYTDLARELGAFLHPEDRVCDAGCGLGLLSRALLPYCGHVTAIDRSPAAITDLTARDHDPRLTALTGDIRDLPPQKPYDAMVFCLFGGTDEILDIAARQCGGTALVVRRDFRQHQFSSGVRMAGHTAADMEQELRRRGLTCTLRRFTLELGQPFRSVEDALAFFRLYSRDGTVPARQELEARLEPSPWPDYPLYLPNPNDGWPNLNLRTFSYVYHTAARAFGEKSKVGNLLKIIENDPNPRTTLPLSEPYYCCGTVCLEQLLFNIDFDYSDYRPVAHVSNTFPTSNFAMLRNNNWNVFVKYGLNGKSHAHPDIMNIEVMYKDQRISRDLSNAGYQSRLCNEWHRKTLSHNTVCWNGQDITSVHPGKCLHFDADSFSGLALDVYEGIDYQRNLHITEDSLVDEFLVQGKPGVYDYVFHLEPQLQLECEMPLEDASLGFSENGYQHVEETKKVLVLGDKAVLWAVFGELRMKIELQLENGQELFLLKTKDNPVNQTRRSILVRARGEKVRYSMQLTV